MSNKFRRFNTVLFKLSASYILIAALSVLLIGVLASIIYKSYFNKQIEASNNIILDNLKDFMDKDILEKSDALYLSIISSDDDLHEYQNFRSGDKIDYIKIKDVSKNLAEKQILNADWCMNLYIYEAESDTLIGTNGIINSKAATINQKPSWFDRNQKRILLFAYGVSGQCFFIFQAKWLYFGSNSATQRRKDERRIFVLRNQRRCICRYYA